MGRRRFSTAGSSFVARRRSSVDSSQSRSNGTGSDAPLELYHTGLVNLGNSCFYNSIVQCVAATQPLEALVRRSTPDAPPSAADKRQRRLELAERKRREQQHVDDSALDDDDEDEDEADDEAGYASEEEEDDDYAAAAQAAFDASPALLELLSAATAVDSAPAPSSHDGNPDEQQPPKLDMTKALVALVATLSNDPLKTSQAAASNRAPSASQARKPSMSDGTVASGAMARRASLSAPSSGTSTPKVGAIPAHQLRRTYNPKSLLRQLSLKVPDYADATQQDAHELLMHLFDGVTMEERDLIKARYPASAHYRERKKKRHHTRRAMRDSGHSGAHPASGVRHRSDTLRAGDHSATTTTAQTDEDAISSCDSSCSCGSCDTCVSETDFFESSSSEDDDDDDNDKAVPVESEQGTGVVSGGERAKENGEIPRMSSREEAEARDEAADQLAPLNGQLVPEVHIGAQQQQQQQEDEAHATTAAEREAAKNAEREARKRRQRLARARPFIESVFGGKLVGIIVCDACKHVSLTNEDFLDISLPLHSGASKSRKRADKLRRTLQGGLFSKGSAEPPAKQRSASQPEAAKLSESEAGSTSASEIESDTESKSQPRRRLFSRSAATSRDASPGAAPPSATASANASNGTLARKFSMLSASSASSATGSSKPSWRSRSRKIPKPTPEQLEYISRVLREIPGPGVRPYPPQLRVAQPPGAADSPAVDSLVALQERIAHHEQTSTDLYASLREFTHVEVLDGENSFACRHCWKLLNPKLVERDAAEREAKRDEKRRLKAKVDKDVTPGSTRPHTPVSIARSETSSEAIVDDEAGGSDDDVSVASGQKQPVATASLPPKSDRHMMRRAHKRYLLSALDLPPVLVLHLKRFQQTSKSLFGSAFVNLKKRDDEVSFPLEMDMAPFLAPTEKPPQRGGGGDDDLSRIGSTRYQLYGVVEHIGTLALGHYVAYVLSDRWRQGDSDPRERRWVFCSDERVRPCSVDEVLKSKAYILFYERVPAV